MLLRQMINMLIANRYVLFEDGDRIGEYKVLDDVPEVYKNAYVTMIMSPSSTAFQDTSGDMFIDIKFGNM